MRAARVPGLRDAEFFATPAASPRHCSFVGGRTRYPGIRNDKNVRITFLTLVDWICHGSIEEVDVGMPDSKSIATRACGSSGWTSGRRDQIVSAILAESVLRSSALGCAAPLGMMGLNERPQDAAKLADKLARVLVDSAPDSLLDLYNRQRRTVAVDFVQEQSIANNKRREAEYPKARRRNLEDQAAIADDPARARQYLLRTSVLAPQARVAAITLEAA